jgi:hypothetical protein
MKTSVSTLIAPLIRRKIFASEEQAVRELLSEHIVRQIQIHRRTISRFERKHGMSFEQFVVYLHERSSIVTSGGLAPEQLRLLGQAVMLEEDDWVEWKAARELLESWVGISGEIGP